MRAFCINLDRRPDRMDYIGPRFAELGIEVERFPAVDGSRPEVRAAAEALPLSPVRGIRISPGAYACFESHRAIWKRMIEEDIPRAILLEDDLVMAPGLAALAVTGGDNWPEAVDVIKIETLKVRVHLDKGPGLPFAGRRLHRLRSTHFGTGGYALTRGAAERLWTGTEGFRDAIDVVMFSEHHPFLTRLGIYQMTPAPVIQGDLMPAGEGAGGAGWRAGSIPDSWASNTDRKAMREGQAARLKRRAGQELRALTRGTRYVTVPFG